MAVLNPRHLPYDLKSGNTADRLMRFLDGIAGCILQLCFEVPINSITLMVVMPSPGCSIRISIPRSPDGDGGPATVAGRTSTEGRFDHA
jgi:hypothetical protein